ncbi:MAG: hypothetical protein PVF91_14720 [Chromatiales bacterium]|jgi:6-phosphogluconate dehydrogenase
MQRVEDSGEGRWTVQEAVDSAVPAPVISLAPMMRSHSRKNSSFAGRPLPAMRAGSGGHLDRPGHAAAARGLRRRRDRPS